MAVTVFDNITMENQSLWTYVKVYVCLSVGRAPVAFCTGLYIGPQVCIIHYGLFIDGYYYMYVYMYMYMTMTNEMQVHPWGKPERGLACNRQLMRCRCISGTNLSEDEPVTDN